MPVRKYSDETLLEMATMREQGKSFGEIARKLGISPSAASWHCLRLGADSPNTAGNVAVTRGQMVIPRGDHVVRRFTDEEDAKLLSMEAAGERVSAIARALGRKPNSVQGRLMTLARREERLERLAEERAQ